MSNKVIIELKPEELIQLNEVLRIADKDFEFCKYDPDSAHEYAVAIMQARNILNMPKGRGHVVRPDLREPVAKAAEPDAPEAKPKPTPAIFWEVGLAYKHKSLEGFTVIKSIEDPKILNYPITGVMFLKAGDHADAWFTQLETFTPEGRRNIHREDGRDLSSARHTEPLTPDQQKLLDEVYGADAQAGTPKPPEEDIQF